MCDQLKFLEERISISCTPKCLIGSTITFEMNNFPYNVMHFMELSPFTTVVVRYIRKSNIVNEWYCILLTNKIAPRDLQKKRGEPGKYIMIDVREGAEMKVQEFDGGIARYGEHPIYQWHTK